MSSFKRRSSQSVGQTTQSSKARGVKPWINGGMGIISCGIRQLDDLIGGGFALGTASVVVSDTYSNYCKTLVSYNIAQSISLGHETLILTSSQHENDNILQFLPYNNNFIGESEVPTTGKKVTKEDSEAPSAPDLKIAWQYEKYIKVSEGKTDKRDESAGADGAHVTQYCSSYDLSRSLQVQLRQSNPPQCYYPDDDVVSLEDVLRGYMRSIEALLHRSQDLSKSCGVARIFLPDFSDLLNSYGPNNTTNLRLLCRFLLDAKHRIRSTRSTILYSLGGTSTSLSALRVLVNLADNVIGVESFAGKQHSVPAEFKEFCGFLYIHKLQQIGAMAPFRPPGSRFGLKRDRKKLHVEPLHLPPEESRAFGSAGTDESLIARAAAQAGAANHSTSPSVAAAELSAAAVLTGGVGKSRHKAGSILEFERESTATSSSGNHAAYNGNMSSSNRSGSGGRSGGGALGHDKVDTTKPSVHLPFTGASATAIGGVGIGVEVGVGTGEVSSDETVIVTPTKRLTLAERFAKPQSSANAAASVSPAGLTLGASVSISRKPPLEPGRACGGGGSTGKRDLDF